MVRKTLHKAASANAPEQPRPTRNPKRKYAEPTAARGWARRCSSPGPWCQRLPADAAAPQPVDYYGLSWPVSGAFEPALAFAAPGVPGDYLHWVGPSFGSELSPEAAASSPSSLPQLSDAMLSTETLQAMPCLSRRQTVFTHDGGVAGLQDRKRMDRILGNLVQAEYQQRAHAKQQLKAIDDSTCSTPDR
ncbi:uncharacterized protein MAM_08112 [Metarhizium album ARSEF 1941]|uniref:Uncharacterized protein n=1 Tax=Metarhizium album (strain ARSEF 1941) TaxID=1081103 RepID=A0A0B2WJD9_METAS|nr:uncharacterized protein MAM_08112 [Metarhizium album ARSEF 1941]KHN94038.1 hypothetical protein MAM_08112 [Metarhizium album ARSEF 1941]